MVEKFSDYEGTTYLSSEGEYVFEITEAELKDSSKGTPMVVFKCKSDAGSTTVYCSLNPKARWKYNSLIKACLKLDTPEKIAAFELDYETIHNQLIGKKFVGVVTKDVYQKEVKVLLDDGTYGDSVEEKESYKISDYNML